MTKNETVKSPPPILIDPTVVGNSDDVMLQKKRQKANAFAKAFPGITAEIAQKGVNQLAQ
jgi:hypothetical protein